MTIVLSAFGDKLRSRPIEVHESVGRYYRMYSIVEPRCASPMDEVKPMFPRMLTFVWNGKREFWDHVGWGVQPVLIYELEET
jgi:hypothetical protein